MKETYYKLTEKGEEATKDFNSSDSAKLSILLGRGILEEVKEEEDTKENLPFTAEIDNMFGNPLEQVEKLTSIKTAEYDMPRAKERIVKQLTFNPKTGEYGTELIKWPRERADEPKPFLDGMTPSEWLRYEYEIRPMFEKTSGVAQRLVIGEFLDILVEELKNRNVIK